jgi:hypothetical protein
MMDWALAAFKVGLVMVVLVAFLRITDQNI